MYDKCKICGKYIEKADDCKLVPGSDNQINTYCLDCYKKLREKKE